MRSSFSRVLAVFFLTILFSPAVYAEKDLVLVNLKSLAESGNAEMQYNLAHYYLAGPPATRDAALALEWCGKAAAQGHETARMYLFSFQEYAAALEKAKKGDAQAQYVVGGTLLAVTQNMADAEGLAWLEKAEKQGHAEAIAFLAQAGFYTAMRELKDGNISEGISRMEKTAAEGNPFAQVFMGVAYADGAYVKRDAAKMLAYFGKAAELEFPPESMDARVEAVDMARMLMASCYLFAAGVPRDTEKAVAWMTKTRECPHRLMAYCVLGDFLAEGGREAEAVEMWERGLALAEAEKAADDFAVMCRQEMMKRLGERYLKGKGVKKDAAKGAKYLLAAMEMSAGDRFYAPETAELLAACYALGDGVPRDEAEAVRRLTSMSYDPRQSVSREVSVWVRMGDIYFDAEKWEDAARWYGKAYEKTPGMPEGWARLAYCYAAGKGVAKDDKTAEKLLGENGEERLADACYAVGDAAETVRWLAAAANKGSAGAWHKIGWCYENGFGVEKNPANALSYYMQAEMKGAGQAKHSVIRCYLYGIGTEKSSEKALEASRTGTPIWMEEGCYEVAKICLHGSEEPYPDSLSFDLPAKRSIDAETARALLERAAAGNIPEARKTLALLKNVPSPEDYEPLLYVPFNIRWRLSPEIAP